MLNIQTLDAPLNGAERGGQFSRKYGKEVNYSRSFGQKANVSFLLCFEKSKFKCKIKWFKTIDVIYYCCQL